MPASRQPQGRVAREPMAPKMAGSMQGQSLLHSLLRTQQGADPGDGPNNLTLIFQLEDFPARQQIATRAGDKNKAQFKPC